MIVTNVDFKLNTKNNVKRHKSTEHSDERTPFSCKFCSFRSVGENDLKKHNIISHSDKRLCLNELQSIA